MKKTISVILTALLLLSVFGCISYAADKTADVYVSIANGTLQLAYKEITVTDSDKDGKLTINDALYLAHEKYYDGGAKAGYKAAQSSWGLSLYKLWGVANGGSYGYYVNDKSAWSLTDEIKTGDHIYAFVYTDTKAFSDAYAYFDAKTATVKANKSLTLTLSSYSYDENWNLVASTVSNAVIIVDGKTTEYKTDKNGSVTLTLSAGEHTVSATCSGKTITPPVCRVTVEELSFIEKIISFINSVLAFIKNLLS